MTMRKKNAKRFTSVLLCLALLLSWLPAVSIFAGAATNPAGTRITDGANLDGWKEFFPIEGDLFTKNAGGIWTDKSVFDSVPGQFPTDITMANDSFLVSLSAIGSTKSVTGLTFAPTDTMLVLDISGSMNDNNNDVVFELVSAANNSIAALLGDNNYNRVGVVLYSGSSSDNTNSSAAQVILPLGRYTTGTDGQYLNYEIEEETYDYGWFGSETVTTEFIARDPDVKDTATNAAPTGADASRVEVVGATYIQKGLMEALDQFQNAATTAADPVLGMLNRHPVLVLMSDGAPSLSSTNFTNPGQYNMGNGQTSSASDAQSFATQLTASYVKEMISARYGTECLFYTLGLAVGSSPYAVSVMDPSASSAGISGLWTQYNAQTLPAGQELVIDDNDSNNENNWDTVTKISTPLSMDYADEYFPAADAAAMWEAFTSIIGKIEAQSAFSPTLIEQDDDLSGYVSFIDPIGQYMQVTDIKGILIGDRLFTGASLASNFAPDANGGIFGSIENPNPAGDHFVWSVRDRLGLQDAEAARVLIGNAYNYGQFSYTDEDTFSNYIGWYADENGSYLGFWHEGITSAPPAGAASIVKSYGYLGAVSSTAGASESDMMYITVRVSTDMATGMQQVQFAVPASLLPLVHYAVSLDDQGALTDLTVSGATSPIRLIYEVALDESINSFTVTEVNAPGGHFYTNTWNRAQQTGYNTGNPYSYFSPSLQNDRFYFTQDATVMADQNGTPYTGSTAPSPSGTFYRHYALYEKSAAGVLTTVDHYSQLTSTALGYAAPAGDGTYYIPAGTVRSNVHQFDLLKNPNATETLDYTDIPFVYEPTGGANTYYIGSTHGNNGRITIAPETGIKISKAMAAGATAPTGAFQFTVTLSESFSGQVPTYRIKADGTTADGTAAFQNGVATVSLEAGDILYIGGLTAGTGFTVAEVETVQYIANNASVQGTVAADSFVTAAFENSDRGSGSLTVAKNIAHDFGAGYQIPTGKTFTIHVDLDGIGTVSTTFPASVTGNPNITSVTTNSSGQFQIELSNDQQLTVTGLPAGTTATVTEPNPGTGFTPGFFDNGAAGDGIVEITNNHTSSVIVVNDYNVSTIQPPVPITLDVTKILEGRSQWIEGDVYTFQLQRYDPANTNPWTVLATKNIDKDTPNKAVSFSTEIQAEAYTTVGTYYYRVVELDTNPVPGVNYDKSVHSFAVEVTDATMDGALEINRVYATEGSYYTTAAYDGTNWNVDIDFYNTYAPDAAAAAIEIHKVITNPSGSPLANPSGFQFAVYNSEENAIAGGSTGLMHLSQPTTGTGTARITPPPFTEDGTYYYWIREVANTKAGQAGWQYDSAIVKVTVVVTSGGASRTAIAYTGDTAPNNPTNTATLTFTNHYTPGPAELNIGFVTKTLVGRDMEAGEFQFSIYEYGTDTVARNLAGQEMKGTNAAAADGTAAAVTFPAWTFDTVGEYFFDLKEVDTGKAAVGYDDNTYRIKVTVTDNGSETLQARVDLLNVAGDTLDIRNTYSPAPAFYTVEGTKNLTGKDLLVDEFTFTLTQATDALGTPASGTPIQDTGNTKDSAHSGRFSFPELTFPEKGTYYYVVDELEDTPNPGIRYDASKYLVTVTVSDDPANGRLVANGSVSALVGEGTELVFNNSYVPASATAGLTGGKQLTGRVWNDSKDIYSFTLYRSNNDWTVGEPIETVKNGTDGSFSFTNLEFDAAGDYYFLVGEVQDNAVPGVTYDTRMDRIHIQVTDNLRGQLIPTVSVYNNHGIPQDGISFTNRYTVTGTDSITLNGEKTVNSGNPGDRSFQFGLYETNSDFQLPEVPLMTAENTGRGFSFQLDYGPADVGQTYCYVVKELAGDAGKGITYDEVRYEIVVTVADDGNGGIIATALINGGETTVLRFNNLYTAAATDFDLVGQKALEGILALSKDSFSFQIFAANGNFEATGSALQTVKNGADGAFRFTDLPLTSAGTHRFVVVESKSDPVPGVTYDDSIFCITVEVTDNGQGKLVAAAPVITKKGAGDKLDAMIFTNRYSAEDLTLSFSVEKTVTSTGEDTISPEGFIFQLEDTDTKAKLSAKSDAKGHAAFDLVFTEADLGKTFTYHLTEVNDARPDVTYSTAVHVITVKIGSTADGKLTAAITHNGKAADKVTAAFENIYNYDPPAKTGDTTDLGLWLAVMVVTGSALLLTIFDRKRKPV